MTSWETIRDSKDYQSLSDDDKASVRVSWLSDNLVTHPDFQALTEEDKVDALNAWEYENGGYNQKPDYSIERFGGQAVEGSKDVARQSIKGYGVAAGLWENLLNKIPATPYSAVGVARKFYGKAKEVTQKLSGAEVLQPDEKYLQSAGFWEDVVRTGPQILSQIGMGMATGGAGATMLMGAQIAGGTYESEIAKGVDPDRASKAAIANAIMQAPLEQIGLSKGLKFIKTRGKILSKLKDLGGALGTEFVTEFLQSYPDAAATIWAEGADESALEQVGQFIDQFGETTRQGVKEGLTVLPFSALGLAGDKKISKQETQQPKLTREQLHSALVSGKMNPEQAQTVKDKYPGLSEVVDGALKDYQEGRPNSPEKKPMESKEELGPIEAAAKRRQGTIDAVDLDILAEAELRVAEPERPKPEIKEQVPIDRAAQARKERQREIDTEDRKQLSKEIQSLRERNQGTLDAVDLDILAEAEKLAQAEEETRQTDETIAAQTEQKRRFKALSSIWDSLSDNEQTQALKLIVPQRESADVEVERQAKAQAQEFKRTTPEQRAIEAQRKLKEADRLGLQLDNRADLEQQAAYNPEKTEQELQRVGQWIEPTELAQEPTAPEPSPAGPAPSQAPPTQESPVIKEPLTAEPTVKESLSVEVPQFKDTESAVKFGEQATPEQVSELQRLENESRAKELKYREAKDYSDERAENAYQAQLYREAIEASKGEHPSQRDTRTAEETLKPINDLGKSGRRKIERLPTVDDNMDLSELGSMDRVSEIRKRFPDIGASEQLKLSRRIKEKKTGSHGAEIQGEAVGVPKVWADYQKRETKLKLKKLKDTLKNEKGSSQLYTDIINHGISLKQKGIDTYEKFKVKMFQKFRKVWNNIKGHMRDLWNALKNSYPIKKVAEQRGEINLERPKDKNIDDLINEIITEKPKKNKKEKEDLRSDHHDSIGVVGNILKSGKDFLFPGELTRKGKKDLSYFGDLLISVPEFFKKKIGAVERIYNASQEKLDEFHEHIYDLENHDDVNSISALKKLPKESYQKVQEYLINVDRTGNGFRVNLSDNQWKVVDPKGRALKSFESEILKDGRDMGEIKAVEEMIKSETAYLIKSGFDEKSAKAIASFRLSTNKGFEILFASMRKLRAQARENGLEEPTFEVANEGKKERLSIRDAMARMGDIRGIYFPRIRKRGQYILTAIKGKERILKTFNSKRIMSVAKSGYERKGFKVETSQNSQLGEDVFDLSGDLLKTQQLVDASLDKASKAMNGPWLDNENEMTKWIDKNIRDMQGLFQSALTEQISNVIKERGFRAHMTKRSGNVWKGYEEDPAVALSKYIRGLAGGESKRNMTMKMLHAMTGTDVSWQEFKNSKKGTVEYKEYMDFVRDRMISARDQKNAFKWAKTYISEMTRNRELSDEIIGTVKGIAVAKYLAFRVFSAPVVNLTALPTSVVATLKGAGIPYTKSWSTLAKGIRNYGKFIQFRKTGKTDDFIFQTIKEKGWDEPQYNSEALSVLRSQVGKVGDWIIDKGMFTFSESERLNRVATIYAAFHGLKSIHPEKSDVDLLNDAKELSDKAHGVYNKGNYPYIVMGKNPAAQLFKMFYVFKTFSHTYLLNMRRLGIDKQWGAISHMVLAPAVLAGLGASVLTPVVNQALKAFGADDPEEDLYKKIGDSFGPTYENLARYGAFGAAGVSVKGSLSIGIGDLPTRLEDLFGAPGSIAKDLAYGAQSLARGDTLKGVEKVLPTGFGNMVRGYREYTEGVTTRTNAPKFYGAQQVKPSRTEAFLRGLSFNPARLAKISEKQWSERKVESKYREWRTDIYAKVKRLVLESVSDDDKWSEVIGEIENYNLKAGQYGFPLISPKSIRRNIRLNFIPSKRERMR